MKKMKSHLVSKAGQRLIYSTALTAGVFATAAFLSPKAAADSQIVETPSTNAIASSSAHLSLSEATIESPAAAIISSNRSSAGSLTAGPTPTNSSLTSPVSVNSSLASFSSTSASLSVSNLTSSAKAMTTSLSPESLVDSLASNFADYLSTILGVNHSSGTVTLSGLTASASSNYSAVSSASAISSVTSTTSIAGNSAIVLNEILPAAAPLVSATTGTSTTVGNLMSQFDNGAFYKLSAESLYTISADILDPGRYLGKPMPLVGDILYTDNTDKTGQAFQVVQSVDSSDPASGYPDNGFQAIAVAPIVNGQVDLGTIIIAFQGINNHPDAAITANGPIDSGRDVLTGMETVVGNQQIWTDGSIVLPSQSVSAVNFANNIKALYPAANTVVTGMSLGGYLALSTGAQAELPVFSFVGDDPSGILTPAQLDFVHSHPSMFVNIRNEYDWLLGAYGGNRTNAAVYYDGGFNGFFGSHYQNWNATYPEWLTFNSAGEISNPAAPIGGPLMNSTISLMDNILTPLADLGTQALAGAAENPVLRPISTFIGQKILIPIFTSGQNFMSKLDNPLAAISAATGKVVNSVKSVASGVTSLIHDTASNLITLLTKW